MARSAGLLACEFPGRPVRCFPSGETPLELAAVTAALGRSCREERVGGTLGLMEVVRGAAQQLFVPQTFALARRDGNNVIDLLQFAFD